MNGFIPRLLIVAAIALTASTHAQEQTRPGDRAYLGLQLSAGPGCVPTASPLPFAACVLGVRPGGAADRAGLRRGDIIRRIGAIALDSPAALQNATLSLRPGDDVDIGFERDSRAISQTVRLTLEDAAASSGPASMTSTVSSPLLSPPIGPLGDMCDSASAASSGLLAPPFRKVALTASAAELEAQLGKRKASITQQGDLLTFAFRASGDVARLMGGSVQCALDRVQGTDLWGLQLRMPGWDRAFLSAQFAVQNGGRWAQTTTEFRGQQAPLAVTRAWVNRLSIDHVPSQVLGETRTVSVYLPHRRPPGPLPVLYMTDGIDLAQFAPRIDELIGKGRIKPIAVIGVHAGITTHDTSKPVDMRLDARAREYVAVVDPPYFARYLRFFVDELMPWAEQRFGVSSARADRAVMGYSNGGAFVEALGLLRPEAAATVLPFSPATPPGEAKVLASTGSPAPRFLFAAGELEPPFLRAARDDAEALRAIGVDASVRTYASGHDTLLWQQALADCLPEVFGQR